jgi:hypothetical protein
MRQQNFLTQLVWLAFIAPLLFLTTCEEGPNDVDKPSLNTIKTHKNISPDSFLAAPGKSIFYWQRDKDMCSDAGGAFYFKGIVFDTMAKLIRKPIPYGDFHLVNKRIPHGPKSKAYKYNENSWDTLDNQYASSSLDVSLDDTKGKEVYDTTIHVLGSSNVVCPDSCIGNNTCLSINETTFNSDFAAVEVSGKVGENRVNNRKILSTEGDGGLNQVCLDDLLDDFSAGDLVEVKIVRAKYYYITGIYGKKHKLSSLSTQTGTFKVCQ